ncbi:helix-turn-helix domain-containing protein [Actinomyces provencensis]|uniref:helix-turn-helix domain-containing protein n=1 Tax=Actinomyces provencensis TaxID=1720198 RepID=UPI00096ABDBD|nr:helix-turn-helix domain-containing protein [Actinomyces provencensis]
MSDHQWDIVMTGAELAATRTWLGVTRAWLGQYLGQSDNDISRMERGKDVVTYRQAEAIDKLVQITLAAETQLAERLTQDESPTLTVWRSDADAGRDPEARRLPAGWWLATAGRLQRQIRDLAVEYSEK